MVLTAVAGNDAGHEGAVLAALEGERGVAVVAVVGIVHVVAKEQALVLVVLNTVDILGHLLQTRQREGVETVQRLAGNLVVAQVTVNLGLLAHAEVEVVLLAVAFGHGVAVGDVLVFRIERLKLAVLLGAGADHVERAIGGAEEIPTVEVVAVAVAVGVAAVAALAGIGPQAVLQTDGGSVETGVDNADDDGARGLQSAAVEQVEGGGNIGALTLRCVTLMPAGEL